MRATLITTTSVILTTAVICNAFHVKKQFYPSVVFITKSTPSMAVSRNTFPCAMFVFRIDAQLLIKTLELTR